MTSNQLPLTRQASLRRTRWWPVVILLAGQAIFLIWVWRFEVVQRQDKNLQTMLSILVVTFLLFLWWLFASRIRWKVRLTGAALFLAVLGLGLSCFRISGVTGDFLPIFEARWKRNKAAVNSAALEASTAKNSVARLAPVPFDYPQMLGPNRDGRVNGIELVRDWQTEPPEILWRRPVGAAWSGFAISGQYAFTMEQTGEMEETVCYDLMSGQPIWRLGDSARYNTTIAGEGPRTVPTIASNRVVTLGATGRLDCRDLERGTLFWSRNILRDHDAELPDWGVSGSPLVFDSFVVVNPGGRKERSLVAYDLATGEVAWSGGKHHAGFSSPILVTLAGQAQVLIFDSAGVSSYEPGTGRRLWEYPWRRGHPHITVPLVLPGDRVLVSSGYGTGSELLHVQRDTNDLWTAKQLWKSNRLKSKFANLIVRGDHVYGLDDGLLVCLSLADGELKWKGERYGHGQMLLVNDLLLIMAESGEIVLVDPNPQAARELSRFRIFTDKTWNPPALAGPYLLVRNDKEAACVRLPLRTVSVAPLRHAHRLTDNNVPEI